MNTYVKAYNKISSIASSDLDSYVVKRDLRLRGFDSNRDDAIESLFLFQVTDRRIKGSNIEGSDGWEHDDELINEIMRKPFLGQVNSVCTVVRKPYEEWFANKTLCTYYDNWERLAYRVCESFRVDVEAIEVVCDIVADIAATPVECLLKAEVEAKREECLNSVVVSAEKIECGPSVDISAEAEKCELNVAIEASKQNCENSVDLQAYIENCSIEYNIDAELLKCIISEALPNLSAVAGKCPEDIEMSSRIIDLETD